MGHSLYPWDTGIFFKILGLNCRIQDGWKVCVPCPYGRCFFVHCLHVVQCTTAITCSIKMNGRAFMALPFIFKVLKSLNHSIVAHVSYYDPPITDITAMAGLRSDNVPYKRNVVPTNRNPWNKIIYKVYLASSNQDLNVSFRWNTHYIHSVCLHKKYIIAKKFCL